MWRPSCFLCQVLLWESFRSLFWAVGLREVLIKSDLHTLSAPLSYFSTLLFITSTTFRNLLLCLRAVLPASDLSRDLCFSTARMSWHLVTSNTGPQFHSKSASTWHNKNTDIIWLWSLTYTGTAPPRIPGCSLTCWTPYYTPKLWWLHHASAAAGLSVKQSPGSSTCVLTHSHADEINSFWFWPLIFPLMIGVVNFVILRMSNCCAAFNSKVSAA